jgi:hypothetical protein
MSAPGFRVRFAGFLALVAVLAALAIFSCSSDPASTLGSDSDLLGSEPGEVIQDTLDVLEDTTYAFNTPISVAAELELGMDSLYTRTMILQPSFSGLTTAQKNAAILHVDLRLPPVDVPGSFPVRFYEYGKRYEPGDDVDLENLGPAINDPDAGSIERIIEFADARHALDPALVKKWIDVDSTREAIVIVYQDTVNERLARFVSVENADSAATLQIEFAGISPEKRLNIVYDATAYRPRYPTNNLIVSDGYTRRVYMRAALDSLASDANVHTARIRFHIVPGSIRGKNTTLLLYIPDSPDPTKADFKTGQRITEQPIVEGDEFIDFPLTNALFLILQGTLKDNGFAIRFKDETTTLRQVELYGTSAPDSLRPRVYATTSSPAVFD